MQFALLGVIILLLLYGLFYASRLVAYAIRGVGINKGYFITSLLVPSIAWGLAAWLLSLALTAGIV